jgi:hypothetical protein
MYLKAAFLFSLLGSSLALPSRTNSPKVKRGVLTVQDYSEFQVSDGVAGNALAEVNAKFPVCKPERKTPFVSSYFLTQ